MLYETVRIAKKATSLVKKASLLISYDKEIGSYKLAILPVCSPVAKIIG